MTKSTKNIADLITTSTTTMASRNVVERYKAYFSWLRNSKFLRELENDSVDSEIIEEELKALQVDVTPATRRERVVKWLQSNPVQFSLCVIIILDAAIVIAQILLDINSVKDMLHHRDQQINTLMAYVRDPDWTGIRRDGSVDDDVIAVLDVDQIIDVIQQQQQRRQQRADTVSTTGCNGTVPSSTKVPNANDDFGKKPEIVDAPIVSEDLARRRRDHAVHAVDEARQYRPRLTTLLLGRQAAGERRDAGFLTASAARTRRESPREFRRSNDLTSGIECEQTAVVRPIAIRPSVLVSDHHHQVAHALHYASILILGLLVVEDLIKIIAMGRTFCEHKMEIIDAIIVVASFAVDIFFLGGVTGDEGQKAAGVVVVLLLWRIARVIDGIVITVKQRQEFRIILLKRARRIAERKLEIYDEERITKNRQIEALKELCIKAGVSEDEMHACTPKNARRVSSTMSALSSIARLSIGMTMSVPSQLCLEPPATTDGCVGYGGESPAGQNAPASAASPTLTPAASVDDAASAATASGVVTYLDCGLRDHRRQHRYSFPQCDGIPLSSKSVASRSFNRLPVVGADRPRIVKKPRPGRRNPLVRCVAHDEGQDDGSGDGSPDHVSDCVPPRRFRTANDSVLLSRGANYHSSCDETFGARSRAAGAAAFGRGWSSEASENGIGINSPVNSTGVQIVIDRSVDDDDDDDEIIVVVDNVNHAAVVL